MKLKHFPRCWPFVRGIHRSLVNSPRKGQWRGTLMFSLICTRINGWVNNGEAGDLRRHRVHYDVIVMQGRRMGYPAWTWTPAWTPRLQNPCWFFIVKYFCVIIPSDSVLMTFENPCRSMIVKYCCVIIPNDCYIRLIYFRCRWPTVRLRMPRRMRCASIWIRPLLRGHIWIECYKAAQIQYLQSRAEVRESLGSTTGMFHGSRVFYLCGETNSP